LSSRRWVGAQNRRFPPWPLTKAQKRVTSEITADLRSERPMRRLLQGDVGSGKTVVAALAMAQWAEAEAQTALLVRLKFSLNNITTR